MRAFQSYCLAAALALASLHAAVAGAAPGAVAHMVICQNGEEVRVAFDAQGTPVDPAPHCPDCVAYLAAVLPEQSCHAKDSAITFDLRFEGASPALLGQTRFAPFARGPPALI